MSDVPRPLKQNMKQYKEQENHLLDVLYTKFLGTPLSEEEEKLIKEIDNALLWYDLKYLLDEELEERQPKLHVEPDYTVRAFSEVEKEYLEIFKRYKIYARNFGYRFSVDIPSVSNFSVEWQKVYCTIY